MRNIYKYLIILFLISSNVFGEEKKNKKIKIEDVNELGNPIKIKISDLPLGMQEKLNKGCISFICITKKATMIMGKSFSRSEDYNNRYPDNMIKAMAYYELFYLGQLNKNKKVIQKYKANYRKEDKMSWIDRRIFKDTKKKIRAITGTNKGRKSMREALGMSIELDPLTAIKRFWYLGELLGMGQTTKNNVSSDMQARAKIMKKYNKILTKMKSKLEEEKDKKDDEKQKN